MAPSERPRAFSGIQPSGELHLGNYLGAVKNWVAMQDNTDALYCIVDLHALSVPHEPGELAANTLALAADLLAIGIDPERSTLFVQSNVAEHSELAWHMQTVAAYGELKRMTQFKDKSEDKSFVSTALFTYPTLQAADIVLYDTEVVPVGDDQRQHIEFTRDITMRFNKRFGETLIVPEHRIPAAGARIKDLQDPTKKMSKSTDSPQGIVLLSDTPASIEKKIKRAVTDNDGEVRFDPEAKPGVSNLLTILATCTDRDPEKLSEEYSQYGPLKADTAAALIATLEPIWERRAALDDEAVAEQLRHGGDKARSVAQSVMGRVRNAVQLFS